MALAADNQRNWRAIEEKAFQELYTHAAKYETNKFLTKEKPVNGGLATLKRTCRDLR